MFIVLCIVFVTCTRVCVCVCEFLAPPNHGVLMVPSQHSPPPPYFYCLCASAALSSNRRQRNHAPSVGSSCTTGRDRPVSTTTGSPAKEPAFVASRELLAAAESSSRYIRPFRDLYTPPPSVYVLSISHRSIIHIICIATSTTITTTTTATTTSSYGGLRSYYHPQHHCIH